MRLAAGTRRSALLLVVLIAACGDAEAARISDIAGGGMLERAARFFTFQDPSLRYALSGSILLGLACGLMGCFLVVRKLALMSDALSHAVLPGVAIGFLWNMTRDPVAIFIGATLAGLLGAATAQAITTTTRHKEDAALGFVLAAFFAVGVCLLTMIQNLPEGNKSGLDKFLFGQAAAMGAADVGLLGVVALLAIAAVALFYKEFLVTSFDAAFARSAGIPVQFFHYALMLLLAFSIVASLQAVGVVLVAAMLVIPAAAAFLLTDRLGWMLMIASLIGMLTGATGAFFSFVGRNLPTGPLMVLTAASIFTLAMVFAPRHGIFARWLRKRARNSRIGRENALKAVYRVIEDDGFRSETVSMRELAAIRRSTIEKAAIEARGLASHGLGTISGEGGDLALTPEGWKRACEIVRNHRLWELYLTHAANISSDRVHDDAEQIEHLLGEENVRQLERRLNYARKDPHGKLIPGIEDIQSGAKGGFQTGGGTGFGRGLR